MSRQPTQPEAFDSTQYDDAYPDGIQWHYWHQGRNRIVHRAVRQLARHRDELVMDVGCGRGICVDYLRRRGVDARGCDLGTPTCITTDVEPFVYLATDAKALPADVRDRVAAVLLLDVLEHVPTPVEVLRTCRRTFPNCRHVVVTVPARMELWSNYDEHFGHFRRYGIASLERLGTDAGYLTAHTSYFLRYLYVPARLMHMAGLRRGVVLRAPSAGLRWLHSLIGWYAVWETRVLPARLPGSSLLAVLAREDEHGQRNT